MQKTPQRLAVQSQNERLGMADIKTQEERSRNMSAIRSKDTKPEQYLRKKLFAEGYRYRKNVKGIPGHPDIYFAGYRKAVFVNGCFWHRHTNCKYAYTPKSRIEFWTEKFSKNVERDNKVKEELSAMGYKCLIVWECTIRKMMKNDSFSQTVIHQITEFMTSEQTCLEI